jgi:hypothetical protein
MLGTLMENVTFFTKTTPTSSPVTRTGISVHLEEFRLHELAALGGEILQTDRKCRIKTADTVWTPTHYDEFTRSPPEANNVLLSVSDGTGRPWTILPSRQIA